MSNHETYQAPTADAAKNKAFVEAQKAKGTERYIQRHSLLARITHGVVSISCILLAISGLFVFVPPLAALVGADAVFTIRMSHRVLGCIFILMPVISAILAPKGAWHIIKEDALSKWDSDDKKWMLLFLPYLFLARWLHMPDQHQNKSGQRFADGMLIILSLLMAVTGVVLTLDNLVLISLSADAHAVWLLLHDIGFFLITVFGMAHIGHRVAELAHAFGAKVIAYNGFSHKADTELIKYLPMKEMMEQADIVSLHCPVTDKSKGLINKETLSYMKPTAFLINEARGPVVVSQDLADALNSGKIAGAGIDVFENEPPLDTNHPLLHAKNTIVTPHVAFATAESMAKRAVIVFDNIDAYLAGNQKNIIL